MRPLFFLVWNEVHADRVDAMSSVFLGEAFAFKDVPQVSTTVATLNLSSDAVRVWNTSNSAWDLLIEAWPTAVRLKLTFRTVQRRTATLADVGALVPESIILARKRRLSSFTDDDTLFLRGKLNQFIFRSRHEKPPLTIADRTVKGFCLQAKPTSKYSRTKTI